MASVMAAMLDELMGRDRNLAPDDQSRGIRWDDKVGLFDLYTLSMLSNSFQNKTQVTLLRGFIAFCLVFSVCLCIESVS